jgi:hypothetical protein
MRNRSFLLSVVCTLAALVAAPASSQTLTAGIDVWTTPNDGSAYVDFTDNPLPAGFFCSGSQAFSQRIALQGAPLATYPSGVLGSTDTIVAREGSVDLGNGQGTTTIRVLAISFVNRSPISVPGCSDTFSAKVTLNGQGPAGSMTIRRSGAAGGTFDSNFSVPGKITFTNNTTHEELKAPATETVGLQTTNAPWANSVGTGGIAHPNPVSIDTNGDGAADLPTPGTTAGFAPGWWNGCNPPCPVKIDHNGPHMVWPLPPPSPPRCPRDVTFAVAQFEAERAESLSATDASGAASDFEAGAEELEEGEESATISVDSNIEYAGQNLTLVNSATLTSPCIVITSTSTYLVAPK